MKTLHLRIPDTEALEANLSVSRPIALWDVVDQPLLYHWFDFAVDQRFEAVCVHCPARLLAIVRETIRKATLWPIEQSVRISTGETGEADFTIDHLPGYEPWVDSLNDEICWLSWHARLVRSRLDHLWEIHVPKYPYLARGHRSTVHPTAVLSEPYWIGEGALIEAGVRVGPGACVGNQTRIGSGGSLIDSNLAAGLEILPDTHFRNHTIAAEFVFNHREKILHRNAAPDLLRPARAA